MARVNIVLAAGLCVYRFGLSDGQCVYLFVMIDYLFVTPSGGVVGLLRLRAVLFLCCCAFGQCYFIVEPSGGIISLLLRLRAVLFHC